MFRSLKKAPKSQPGFTLVEMLLVLGVLALLMVAMFMVYPGLRAQQQAQDQAKQFKQVHASLLGSMSGANFYAFQDRTAVINARILTEEQLTSPWGDIRFHDTYPSGYGCASAQGCTSYTLEWTGVSQEFCVRFLPMVESMATRIRVQADSNNILKGSGVRGPDGTAPTHQFDIGEMTQACNDGDIVGIYITAG